MKKDMPMNEGKMVRNGTPKTIDCPGKSDGGGSADIAAAAKAINQPKKGGAPGL